MTTPTKQALVENWLPRYTGLALEDFGRHILLTNFNNYVEKFADWHKVDIQGQDRPMPNATAEGITIINFGMGSANAATVLDLLSAQSDRNIVPLPSVAGAVTVSLQNVTLDDALDAVLKSTGLVSRKEERFIYVGTHEDFERADSGDLQTRVYRPNYITAQELQQMVLPLLTAGVG